jgi:hypothetical protein
MEVDIHRVFLTVEGRREKLTKSIAKQLPTLDGKLRWRAAELGEDAPEPICKVMGSVLGHTWDWMYLVKDEAAGLGWVAAMQIDEDFAVTIIERGGWVDDPSKVPTVIL